jgi:hypothetical protein
MTRYREIYRANQLPIYQNRLFDSKQDARNCAKGDVVLVQDIETGLIFNRAFKSELMLYDDCYQNEQAFSMVFRKHLLEVSNIINGHFNNLSLIEVGCGKGYFLEQLRSLGYHIVGFDPAYEGSNPCVIKKYFSPDVRLRADGVILRHVLEHVQDPVAFIINICDSNGGKGKIYIEVPCFDWICRQRAWFDIYYEHVNYFRMSDFIRMFGRIFQIGHTFGGQYLYVIADLSTVRMPKNDRSDRAEFPRDFLDTVNGYVNRIKSQKKHSIIWGGASKGVIFGLFMYCAGAGVDVVVDISPAKQGKYLPATGLRVYSPKEAVNLLSPGSDVFVMNSNYITEIKELTNYRFNYLQVDNDII